MEKAIALLGRLHFYPNSAAALLRAIAGQGHILRCPLSLLKIFFHLLMREAEGDRSSLTLFDACNCVERAIARLRLWRIDAIKREMRACYLMRAFQHYFFISPKLARN